MSEPSAARHRLQNPLWTLTAVWVLWKTALLGIVLASPGPGYDTSTTLLNWQGDHSLVAKFVRWDAIYFTQIAQHGHVFEQQWAFGIGISSILDQTSRVLFAIDKPMLWQITISGVLISHLSSWVSMVLIWSIAASLTPGEHQTRAAVAFVAALLYIVSPAGVFLSAPYTESIFAAMNLLGLRLFLWGRDHNTRGSTIAAALFAISGGLASCLATLIRSNGILSGMLYAWDAVACVLNLARRDRDPRQIVRLVSLGLGGALIACGMILPQYKAYCEYCTGPQLQDIRPWCHDYLPSIFTFVQSHYWNVGTFRYWTVSNLPLFLLAAPTLAILLWSGYDCFLAKWGSPAAVLRSQHTDAAYLAAPQFVLAILAITNYHVQIITRISTGYPYWYIWLALVNIRGPYHPQLLKVVLKWMVLYAAIQAGLYASFLPPA